MKSHYCITLNIIRCNIINIRQMGIIIAWEILEFTSTGQPLSGRWSHQFTSTGQPLSGRWSHQFTSTGQPLSGRWSHKFYQVHHILHIIYCIFFAFQYLTFYMIHVITS